LSNSATRLQLNLELNATGPLDCERNIARPTTQHLCSIWQGTMSSLYVDDSETTNGRCGNVSYKEFRHLRLPIAP
jgi:hypothetical protein